MRYPVRLRVFLLCCLLMIGMNVLLIISGLVSSGSMAGDVHSLPGSGASIMPRENQAGSSASR
jgi:hypothetical protein